MLHALRYQQPRLLDYARQLMEDPALSWRAGVETFLKNCCYGAESGVAVLSIEEERQARHCLSEENFQPFDRTRSVFMGNCSPSLASLWTVLTHGCLAIWPQHDDGAQGHSGHYALPVSRSGGGHGGVPGQGSGGRDGAGKRGCAAGESKWLEMSTCPSGRERQTEYRQTQSLGIQVLVLCGLFAPCVSLSK